MSWQPTPVERRFLAEKVDGTRCSWDALRVGDVFRTVDPAGEYIDPFTREPDSACYCVAKTLPTKLTEDVQAQGFLLDQETEGYCLHLTTHPSLHEALRTVSN